MQKPLIIAEIGSSPAPAWDFAQWCEGARAVGADAIKAQLFRAEHFPEGEQASKQALEFPRERLREFVDAARANGLRAGASVFDLEAMELVGRYCDFMKLAAREQDNIELLGRCMASCQDNRRPLYRSISDTRHDIYLLGIDSVTLFTIQSYPAGMIRSVFALLKAASFFKTQGGRWGWSSHTTGAFDCVLAARLGAEVIEKHFSLGADNLEAAHSLLPHQFAAMVERIK